MGFFTDKDRLKSVSIGQIVVAHYDSTGAGIRCVVEGIGGVSAFVTNSKRKFTKWVDIRDLFPYDERVKAYAAKIKQQKNQSSKEPF